MRVPSPDVIVYGLTTAANGGIPLAFIWPAGVASGTTLSFQYWITDSAGPQGFSASNGVSGTAP